MLQCHLNRKMTTEAIVAHARTKLPTSLLLQLNTFLPAAHRVLPASIAACAGPAAHPKGTPPTTTPAPAAAAAAPASAAAGDMMSHLTEAGWRAQLERETAKPCAAAAAACITRKPSHSTRAGLGA
jgi:hypothetical protein